MTKQDMVTEILKDMRWNEAVKTRNIKRAVERHSKGYIELVYNFFIKDSGNALFYATLLTR